MSFRELQTGFPSFIAKTLERAVFNQVSTFLTQNNLLDSNQSGLRSGHSTETALLSVVEALRLAKADSKSSVLILLDLSTAFDMVNHQILLSTLLAKGILGTALQWFESYLSDRSFKKHAFSYHCYDDDTELYLSFHPDDPMIAARISDCLTDISC
ncbi:putative RNA-directed DNA polymerase from transposon BS [Labeo rohita]|uniref:RNA-directed DNA polymerase from transposon BS n=1 Tax=Labeo rohita TaxID=84645 RepID=A0ABQ8LYT6_LABRO|nr:putative RNA-directed DNA polymerase from transposon BS [Labeo rohita]